MGMIFVERTNGRVVGARFFEDKAELLSSLGQENGFSAQYLSEAQIIMTTITGRSNEILKEADYRALDTPHALIEAVATAAGWRWRRLVAAGGGKPTRTHSGGILLKAAPDTRIHLLAGPEALTGERVPIPRRTNSPKKKWGAHPPDDVMKAMFHAPAAGGRHAK